MKSVMVVAGTRPGVIKLLPVLEQLHEFKLDTIFIWSDSTATMNFAGFFLSNLRCLSLIQI